MEEKPEFARGCAVFGNTKNTIEEQWITLVKKLNSLGPPIRSIVEWKKTWADLKSRTKRKIAENKRSLIETGGGLYRENALSDLEQIIERTLFLSKAAAPSGKVFGFSDKNNLINENSFQSCFKGQTRTPPRSSKAAVITPSKQQQISEHHSSQQQEQAAQPLNHPQQQDIHSAQLAYKQK